MTNNNNAETAKRIIEALRLSPVADRIPTQYSNLIMPVVDVLPDHSRKDIVLGSAAATASGATAIIQASSTRRTFLTGAMFTFTKDAACANTTSVAGIRVESAETGAVCYPIYINSLNLTAETKTIYVYFKNPIEILRGSYGYLNNFTFLAGNSACSGSLFGYMMDD